MVDSPRELELLESLASDSEGDLFLLMLYDCTPDVL